MIKLKNQQGYALLVVLLMVVLFLGISATFMAGSLSNAKQEKIIDTSNQAVASAEMGVKYFSSDFQREIDLIKLDIAKETQALINLLTACIEAGNSTCDEQDEITEEQEDIEEKMKDLYITKVYAKVSTLTGMAGNEIIPFYGDDVKYSIKSATAIKLNQSEEDISGSTLDKEVKFIRVNLEMEGVSEGVRKTLKALFTLEVPGSFLNAGEPIVIQTSDDTATYKDIFNSIVPSKTCAQLLGELPSVGAEVLKECKLGPGETLADILTKIKAKNLDPKDFKIYTDDFLANVCTGKGNDNGNGNSDKCNGVNFEGITIVVSEGDAGASNNMNNLINANLIINGGLSTGNNLNNMGKKANTGNPGENGVRQTVILKELNVTNNIQNMNYTNLLILGFEVPEGAKEDIANVKWGQNFDVDNYSRLCVDIDKIIPSDLSRMEKELKFTNSSYLVFFSRNADKKFVLRNSDGSVDDARTELHVKRGKTYTEFLGACDVSVDNTIKETEISVPMILDPGFDLEVEY
ncbi:hypothetical protein [Planomicrobium okeanokoites]|uniref:hypothetical protein n=1 Tax=Planomicrobium okeanokoites TaxID=244 RepID=UPI0030F75256